MIQEYAVYIKFCVFYKVNIFILFHNYTSVGGLLVPDGIIRPVVSASALTW